jgi:hypothetical protein
MLGVIGVRTNICAARRATPRAHACNSCVSK